MGEKIVRAPFNPARLVRTDKDGNKYMTLDAMLAWFYNDRPGWHICHDGTSIIALEDYEPIMIVDEETQREEESTEKTVRHIAISDIAMVNDQGVRVCNVPVDGDPMEPNFSTKMFERGIYNLLDFSGYNVNNITDADWEAFRLEKMGAMRPKLGAAQPAAPQQQQQKQPEPHDEIQSILPNIGLLNDNAPDTNIGKFINEGKKQEQSPAQGSFQGELKGPTAAPMPTSSEERYDMDRLLDLYSKWLEPKELDRCKDGNGNIDKERLSKLFDKYCLRTVGEAWKRAQPYERDEVYNGLIAELKNKGISV